MKSETAARAADLPYNLLAAFPTRFFQELS
jgi:hypothetical protein